jgi:hypothetical protein
MLIGPRRGVGGDHRAANMNKNAVKMWEMVSSHTTWAGTPREPNFLLKQFGNKILFD